MIPVSADLGRPEVGPGCWHFAQRTTMSVPETAMHQDNSAVSWKQKIRTSRQVLAMQPEAQAPGVQPPSQDKLRLCVPSLYAAHVEPPLFRRKDVRQGISHSAATSTSDVTAVDGVAF